MESRQIKGADQALIQKALKVPSRCQPDPDLDCRDFAEQQIGKIIKRVRQLQAWELQGERLEFP